MDDAKGATGGITSCQQAIQTFGQQQDVGMVLGQRGGTGQRDRDIGAAEHRGVVDAVAHHGDAPTLLLEFAHEVELVLGAGAGALRLGRQVQLPCDVGHAIGMVPRDDAALHAVGTQPGQCLGCAGAQGFGQAEAGVQGSDRRRDGVCGAGVCQGESGCGRVLSGMCIRFWRGNARGFVRLVLL